MNNEKGYALLVSILSIVLIGIIGISLFSITTVTHSQSTHERKDQSIFYIAEAGLNIKEARIKKLIDQAFNDSKANEANFEATFDSKLQGILNDEEKSVYDNTIFKSDYNGNPEASVKIIVPDSTNIRAFKIVSEGSMVGTSKKRKVERSYTIPGTLITKTTIQQPILNPGTPPSTPPPLPGPIVDGPVINGPANNYVTESLEIHAIHKNNSNMRSYTSNTASTWLPFNWWLKNSDNVYKNGYVNKEPIKIQHKILPYDPKPNGPYLAKTSDLQKLTNNVIMPNLDNLKSFVFNIETNDNITIYFPNDRTKYNLNSTRINVRGTGTVNLVFKESFHLDSGTKFVVDTKNSSAKVNMVFEHYAQIFGELHAQDIYFPGSVNNLEVHTNGKVVANDIFVDNGNVNKQTFGDIKANNISIQKGNLDVMTQGAVLANHVQLMDGTFSITGLSGKFISNSLSVLKGRLEAAEGTCIRSKDIFVKDGRIDSASTLVYENLSVKVYSSYGGANVNKNFSKCSAPSIVIEPPADVPVQEYIDVNQYTYESTYLHSQPLIEVE